MFKICNLGKVNLETTLAGQQLSPRHAGLCGVAGVFKEWHVFVLDRVDFWVQNAIEGAKF